MGHNQLDEDIKTIDRVIEILSREGAWSKGKTCDGDKRCLGQVIADQPDGQEVFLQTAITISGETPEEDWPRDWVMLAIVGFNDAPGTTIEDVLLVLKKTKERMEA